MIGRIQAGLETATIVLITLLGMLAI